MEFICSTTELKEAVLKINKVINKSTTLGILETIAIQTDDANLLLRGTDLGNTIGTVIEANVSTQGASTIDAKTFLEILDKVKTEDVKLKFDMEKETITITSGDAVFELVNDKMNDKFPDNDKIEKNQYFSIEREELVKGFALTLFSVSKDNENKQFLTGINVTVDDSNNITFVSTDTQRLSKYETTALDKVAVMGKPINFIIPSQAAKILMDLAKTPGDPLKIYWSGSLLNCTIDNADYYARLIESKYPDITRVIPKDFNTEIVINKAKLSEVLGRMNIASKENGDRSLIKCEDNTIVFSAETKEHNISVKEKVPCILDGVNIDKMVIHVKHMLEILSVMDQNCDNIEIKTVAAEKAFTVKMKDNDKFTHVLMPLKVY
ncbi:MAG: DNA polymerase III subunit beta [Abditibacteriota bacterium]|nr:DNA polymerase III subunit beta [Abditibacteriota bacterium]